MMVGLNEHGLVHDFYYPYVGLDNLTTARSVHHKIGIWVNGFFSWVDGKNWQTTVNLEANALFGNITLVNKKLGVKIETKDFVDPYNNSFIRRFKVQNLTEHNQDIKIFMHQVFEISRSGRADTAFYVPDSNYILDYKGRCALLIYCQDSRGKSFDQYAVGNYGIEGKAGTYLDAEDGELSGNNIEHGGVDSVMRLNISLEPATCENFDYWIVASSSQYESEEIHQNYLLKGIDKIENKARQYWQDWFKNGHEVIDKLPDNYQEAVKKSLLIIKAHIDDRGGILASGDSSIFNYGRDYYCYVWPRDGAYAVWPLIRMGFYNEARNFFEFCRDTINKSGYMMHKYQPDRAIGSTWHPLMHEKRKELAIQEDETAGVLFMLGEYYDYSKDKLFIETMYSTFIQPAGNFMNDYIDEATNLPHASYDLWEEKFLTTTYTTAVTIRALKRAADFADLLDYPDDAIRWRNTAQRIEGSLPLLFDPERKTYRKGLFLGTDGNLQFDNTIDASSLYGILMYTNCRIDDEYLKATAEAVEKELTKQHVGGFIRYENDWYMRANADTPPNPWHVCTLWMAQYYIQIKQQAKAKELIDWSLYHSFYSGALSEQVHPNSGMSVGVTPLVWSHAELINSILDYSGAN
jgi:GH15 family glucan-1,4-alpha-glucosidase